MFNIISLVIILVSLAIILVIIFKKLPFLATFDVDNIPKEVESKTKEKIINERLQRKAKFFYSKVEPIGSVLSNLWQRKLNLSFNRLKDLEEKYRKKNKQGKLITKKEYAKIEKTNESLINEAKELSDQEDYEQAEKKYIDIISADPKNVEAYRGLGNLYFLQKNYTEAKQTFEHILKLNQADDLSYARLGEIASEQGDYDDAKQSFLKSLELKTAPIHFFELAEVNQKLEEYDQALENLQKALDLEPNNPKYLDLFITISLQSKNKKSAQKAIDHLKKINPENQKIEEFEDELKEL